MPRKEPNMTKASRLIKIIHTPVGQGADRLALQ